MRERNKSRKQEMEEGRRGKNKSRIQDMERRREEYKKWGGEKEKQIR